MSFARCATWCTKRPPKPKPKGRGQCNKSSDLYIYLYYIYTISISLSLYIYIYRYVPRTQLTFILEGQPSKTRPFSIKTRVIWVLCISHVHKGRKQQPKKKEHTQGFPWARMIFWMKAPKKNEKCVWNTNTKVEIQLLWVNSWALNLSRLSPLVFSTALCGTQHLQSPSPTKQNQALTIQAWKLATKLFCKQNIGYQISDPWSVLGGHKTSHAWRIQANIPSPKHGLLFLGHRKKNTWWFAMKHTAHREVMTFPGTSMFRVYMSWLKGNCFQE